MAPAAPAAAAWIAPARPVWLGLLAAAAATATLVTAATVATAATAATPTAAAPTTPAAPTAPTASSAPAAPVPRPGPGASAPQDAPVSAPLPALGAALDAAALTVSGLSSGGYMAGQFQVAYAARVAGAALVAAGPYGCTQGSLFTALRDCACPPPATAWQAWLQQLPGAACRVPPAAQLQARADSALQLNQAHLDAPAALARHRVWLLTGQRDTVVPPALVEAAASFYRQHGVPAARLRLNQVAGAAHGLPTPTGPVDCGQTASPFLTHCERDGRRVDAPAALLAFLLPARAPAAQAPAPQADPAALQAFDQRPYRAPGRFDGLDDSGWVYIPAACRGAAAAGRCAVHVVFHGCAQGQGFQAAGQPAPIGRAFVDGAGYNRWAEAMGLVLLYPQVRASQADALALARGDTFGQNPEGCWDFWGYTDPDGALHGAQRLFARRDAPQLQAVWRMVQALHATPGR